jgi:hemerythrin-like domain-containing protein
MPIEQLKKEHNAIKLMLKILDAVSLELEAGKKIIPGDLDKMAEFIKIFSDKCHHGKEEDLLFPAMEEAGIPKDDGPIRVMLEEHDIGRNYVKELVKAVEEYKGGDKKAAKKIAQSAGNYTALLSQHIDKENNILYPIAEDCLSPEKKEELLEAFERAEEEKIGEGKHEEFHRLLERLEKTYL